MNALHLHLSDDQGWRIEIKSWPKLTEIGGSTEVGGGEGGFYTQEQYADIVKYAQDRNIIIIPEIDMPGHTNAALASYAELNCDGKARELYTGIEVGFSTLCTSKEITYQFVDDVIREIAEITPGPYFHIGGDESHVTPLEDYIPFVNRVQEIVVKHGKKVIGWDEIANATPVEGATVQFWDNLKNTGMALEKGAKVIISPASKAYLDMQYDSTTHLGLHWAGYIEVDKGYSWNPLELVPGITKEQILGVEAPLWTETVTNISEVEFMVFPRLPGYAEIGWTSPDSRSWEEYKLRLAQHGKRFEAMDINFYRSPMVPWEE
jgi:hexosaminidase